jgi:hypothetical protein
MSTIASANTSTSTNMRDKHVVTTSQMSTAEIHVKISEAPLNSPGAAATPTANTATRTKIDLNIMVKSKEVLTLVATWYLIPCTASKKGRPIYGKGVTAFNANHLL